MSRQKTNHFTFSAAVAVIPKKIVKHKSVNSLSCWLASVTARSFPRWHSARSFPALLTAAFTSCYTFSRADIQPEVFPQFSLPRLHPATHFPVLFFDAISPLPWRLPMLPSDKLPGRWRGLEFTEPEWLQTCESAKRSCSHNFPLYCPPEFHRYNPIQPPWASSKNQKDINKKEIRYHLLFTLS